MLYLENRSMKSVLLFALLCSGSFAADEPVTAAPSDPDVPLRGQLEIARRGNLIEHISPEMPDNIADAVRDTIEQAIGDALAVPPDDSHKWFITLVAMPGCKPCESLRYDFMHSEHLKPWVAYGTDGRVDHKNSWAHFTIVQSTDATQSWRFTKFKPRAFPTLIIQPPFNGSFGNPSTMVGLWEGYDGDANELNKEMREAIVRYVAKVAPQHIQWKASQSASTASPEGGIAQGFVSTYGRDPPVAPPSILPPPQPGQATIPPGPSHASMEELLVAIPEADLAFLREQVSKKATLEEAKSAWADKKYAEKSAALDAKLKELEEKAKRVFPPPVEPAPNLPTPDRDGHTVVPTDPTPARDTLIGAGLVLGIPLSVVVGIVVVGLLIVRAIRKKNDLPPALPSPIPQTMDSINLQVERAVVAATKDLDIRAAQRVINQLVPGGTHSPPPQPPVS
jgi:hypothetical protein